MNILEIIKRVKISCGYSSDAELARALNMSPQNFLSQKKTGKIKDSLMVHAIERGVNIDWIKTGQGIMTGGHGFGTQIKETTAPYGSDDTSSPRPKISDLLSKTAAVLESKSIFSNALTSNIEAFHEAINLQTKLAQHESMMKEQEARLKTVEDRLYSVEQKDKAG